MRELRRVGYSLRVAQGRQLRARALRPVRRRQFPAAASGGGFAPLNAAFWLTEAFAGADEVALDGAVRILGREIAYPPADWKLPGEPRLRAFHLHYGEDVLGWARRGDTTAAAAALAAWIEGNPPRPGDAWHPYPLSTRVGNWVAALSIAPELATPAALESLRRQLGHLERNVEDDVLGNHVVRNARGLILGGTALGLPTAVERGEELLRREVPEQILSDGGHYERSPVYHLIVLRDLLEVRAATGLERLDGPIEAMRRFAAALARPDGTPALFNDGGLDLAPRLELPEPPTGLTVFAETGYAVVRTGRLWLVLDCGPPAPPFLPAHAHADALSIQLWWDGRPVLVDTGTSTYEAGPERDRLRSTRAHSTVALDRGSQFETWRAFRAGPLPVVCLDGVGSSSVESHVEWPGGVIHRRCVEWTDQEVIVRDKVEGAGRHRADSRLVRAPGAANALVELLDGEGAETEPGWVSERFGERVATDVRVASREQELPLELGWRVRALE